MAKEILKSKIDIKNSNLNIMQKKRIEVVSLHVVKFFIPYWLCFYLSHEK
uniref:Uncharacterized protein n=1 Tax=Promethearchaeum syntrophicum TaxID=2594042 RepID=A0A5B9DAI9_9ARCH|nr:hypothetical protein DSAG12_01972 [Candidatus Prometheoarchaeum syntrophicum]